jgi:acetyl esterase
MDVAEGNGRAETPPLGAVASLTVRVFSLAVFLVCLGPACAQTPAEEAPVTIAGAETHVFRALEPVPLRLHVFKPEGWKPGDQRAAFLFFFGGGWTTGTPEKAESWARLGAGWGMVGVVADYRTKGRHDTSPLASVADSRAALRWLQDHAEELGIDPRRIAVGGNSAGGHVALWTGIRKAPPGSAESESPRFKPAVLFLNSAVSDTSQATGYTPVRFGEHATALSPLHQLDAKMPPVLAFHGDADSTVPHRQAAALHARLVESGNESELHTVPGGTHQLIRDTPGWEEKGGALLREFFLRHRLIAP